MMNIIISAIYSGKITDDIVNQVESLSPDERCRLEEKVKLDYAVPDVNTITDVCEASIIRLNTELLLDFCSKKVNREDLAPAESSFTGTHYAIYNDIVYAKMLGSVRGMAMIYRGMNLFDWLMMHALLTLNGLRMTTKRLISGFTYIAYSKIVVNDYEVEYTWDDKKEKKSFYDYYYEHYLPNRNILQREYPKSVQRMQEDIIIMRNSVFELRLADILKHPRPLKHITKMCECKRECEVRKRIRIALEAKAGLGHHLAEFAQL